MITTTMENIIKEGLTPIGVLENGETFGLSKEERPGILHLFGRPGYGKASTLENIVVSDIHNGRGGMLIDPQGDLIKDIQGYIPAGKENKVVIFGAEGHTVSDNIAKFEKEIDMTEMKSDDQKFLLCKLDYRTLGMDGARELGINLVKRFLQVVGGENRSLVLDEAHNFIDAEILEMILKSREQKLSCFLSDQTSLHYRTDFLEPLLKEANHILCYYLDKTTAEIINKYNPQLNPVQLTTLPKYNFYAKLNAKTASLFIAKAQGIFPIPFSKK